MGLAPLVSWNDSVVGHHRPFLRCCKGNHSLRNWQVICDFFSSCSDFGIFRRRDLVLNTMMRALGVVVFNVVLDAFTQFLDIVRGIDISYFLAMSTKVDCSLRASITTFALNSGMSFLRVV